MTERKQQKRQIVFTGVSLCLVLALQAFMVVSPTFILGSMFDGARFQPLVSVCCQLSFAASFAVIAYIAYSKPALLERPPFILATASLAAGFLTLTFAWFWKAPNVVLITGILFGAGQALVFACYTRVFASLELTLAKMLIAISSIFPIIPFFMAVAFHGSKLIIAGSVSVVLFPLSMVALFVSLKTVPIKPLHNYPDATKRARYSALLGSLKTSFFLVFALGVLGSVVGVVITDDQISDLVRILISQAGNTFAALVALLLIMGFRVSISVPMVFSLSFPIIVTSLFALPCVDPVLWPAFIFVDEVVFCLASIAVMITCLEVSHVDKANILVVYGVFAAGMYVSRVVGYVAGIFLHQIGGSDSVYFVALLMLYVFSLVVFLAYRNRPLPVSREKKGLEARKADGNSLKSLYGISDRENDVLDLLLKGKSVAVIAESLSISNNTVKTHIKKIYAAFGVHSRQELLSFADKHPEIKAMLDSELKDREVNVRK